MYMYGIRGGRIPNTTLRRRWGIIHHGQITRRMWYNFRAHFEEAVDDGVWQEYPGAVAGVLIDPVPLEVDAARPTLAGLVGAAEEVGGEVATLAGVATGVGTFHVY